MRKFLYPVLIWFLLITVAFAASQETSGTSAQSIINDAKALLNGSDDAIFNDTEMLQWLNDGQIDIAARSQCLQTTESKTLIANTIEYTITANYATVKAVTYTNASGAVAGLEIGSPSELGRLSVSVPVKYYEWDRKIGVYPPLSSVTTETVTLYLIQRPTAITISDNITVPAIYDKALTDYIVAQSLWKDRQTGRYAQMMQSYLDQLMLYRVDLNEIKQESNR